MSSPTPAGPVTNPDPTTAPGPATSPDPGPDPVTGPDAAAVPRAAIRAAEVADAKQGSRTAVLAMGGLLGVTDAFVITSARNTRLVRTIVEEIEAQLKRLEGRAPLRVEGLGDLQWVLMDYGDLVVHVFLDETREVYDLERLWGDAPRVSWQPAAAPARA